jgi:hypothetical protein
MLKKVELIMLDLTSKVGAFCNAPLGTRTRLEW